ncbi:hypothetical protein PILCRDRAFT_605925 [Piloderma croceum F 1598]|uniref:Uncharacterized protein n=1 Tax=Piloderma croceum (strain F 1598) TaxID=765440 RepID=A0A0C3AVB0_PILCF|nr:hypothetical protein PILCRDRAFT_605925 [Piloderma croceum F 1598]
MPVDLTMDKTKAEQSFNEPNIATEGQMVTCASSSRFIAVGPATNIDGNTSQDTDANAGEVGRARDDSGLVGQGEAVVESAIAAPALPPRRADNCNCTDMKMEDVDENRILLARSPPQLTVDYLDLIYHTESPVVFCRLCIIRQDKDSSPDIRVSFPINTSRHKLIDHYETEHPVEARKFALMRPEKLAKIRSQIPRSGG